MNEMPIIRLEVEQIKHQILHHFGQYQKEVSVAVEKQIEKVIGEFDFYAEIKPIVEKCLRDNLNGYFSYGEGNTMINNSLQEALDKTFKKETE